MSESKPIGWLLGVGLLLMVLALFFQTITLANGNYGLVLAAALALTVVADSCFIATFVRGGTAIRALSILLMLPTVFVIADFIRRAHLLG